MTKEEIINCRLASQQISHQLFTKAEDLVSWMGCLQAQDFGSAKWAIGLRLKQVAATSLEAGIAPPTDMGIEQLFNESRILRTHLLRPTWHFVHPADIRWMLALTAPRIKALCKGPQRQLGLDRELFRRSNAALEKALRGGKKLSRQELEAALHRAGLKTGENRMSHFLIEAELDSIICSAGLRGRQFTYALLDEWAPEEKTAGKGFQREESLAKLALRYFRSRGPATLADFAWWSGLTIADARLGVEINRSHYDHAEVEGTDYWWHADCFSHNISSASPQVLALPAYDEYTIAYTDRSLVVAPKHELWTANGILKPAILHNGQVVGTWQRATGKGHVTVKTELFRKLGKRSIKTAFERYSAFVEKKIVIDS